MLNAANINFIAFWRYGAYSAGEGPLTGVPTGQGPFVAVAGPGFEPG